MINNKGKTYALLVVVLAIWGVVGYQVFSGLNPQPVIEQSAKISAVFKLKQYTEVDTFSIDKLDRDPFLGIIYKPQKKRLKKRKKQPVNWPQISYQGIISEQKGEQNLYVITINGQQELLKKKETFNEVTLVNGTSEYIRVKYKSEQKKIVVQ